MTATTNKLANFHEPHLDGREQKKKSVSCTRLQTLSSLSLHSLFTLSSLSLLSLFILSSLSLHSLSDKDLPIHPSKKSENCPLLTQLLSIYLFITLSNLLKNLLLNYLPESASSVSLPQLRFSINISYLDSYQQSFLTSPQPLFPPMHSPQ